VPGHPNLFRRRQVRGGLGLRTGLGHAQLAVRDWWFRVRRLLVGLEVWVRLGVQALEQGLRVLAAELG
jgi:hypothetical protein